MKKTYQIPVINVNVIPVCDVISCSALVKGTFTNMDSLPFSNLT